MVYDDGHTDTAALLQATAKAGFRSTIRKMSHRSWRADRLICINPMLADHFRIEHTLHYAVAMKQPLVCC